MFNPLAGAEADGNATFTPHPVNGRSSRAHFGEVRFTEPSEESADGARVCAASIHTRSRSLAWTNARGKMLSQRICVANTGAQYHPPVTRRQLMTSKASPPAATSVFTFSYCSQEAFVLVIPSGEKLQHFILLHLSVEESGFKQQYLAHWRRMG